GGLVEERFGAGGLDALRLRRGSLRGGRLLPGRLLRGRTTRLDQASYLCSQFDPDARGAQVSFDAPRTLDCDPITSLDVPVHRAGNGNAVSCDVADDGSSATDRQGAVQAEIALDATLDLQSALTAEVTDDDDAGSEHRGLSVTSFAGHVRDPSPLCRGRWRHPRS